MALILSLETSTQVCSVALHDQGKLLASGEVHIEQSHASKLALLIDDVKELTGIELNQLKAVAISSGPGSYTGLRIGTSTAKGLCFALDTPLIAVNTLDLLVYQGSKINPNETFLCPMIDARRMEVYCQVVDAQLQIRQSIEAKVIDEFSFLEYLNEGPVLFFGNGANKCREMIKHTNAQFPEDIFPAASQLGCLAFQKFEAEQFEDLMHFEPYYLKDFVAKKANLNL